jgi:hypothetical protein
MMQPTNDWVVVAAVLPVSAYPWRVPAAMYSFILQDRFNESLHTHGAHRVEEVMSSRGTSFRGASTGGHALGIIHRGRNGGRLHMVIEVG